jgi:hypothetical protein
MSNKEITGMSFVEGTKITHWYLQHPQSEAIPMIQGTQHVQITFFEQHDAYPHTANLVLDTLHDAFGNCVLLN